MLKMKFAAYAVAILAAVSVSASAQQATQAGVAGALPDGKVAVLNTLNFREQIGELKQKYDQVENQFKDRYQKLQTMQQQLATLENDIKVKGPTWPAEKQAQERSNYEELSKQFKRAGEDFNSELEKAEAAAVKPVQDKLFQFLQNYAKQRGIVMIINLAGISQTRSLAYVDPKMDITDDFIKEYNKANPVPTTAAPAAATPAPVKKP
ncbi:MAG TPA: OmpH family outer membrane protein [Blastocatellia bacterium]|nr:OmpH family outer membrane protein [Blastocatellia bacterium]